MCLLFGFADTWNSQNDNLWIKCRFATAEGNLRKPAMVERRSKFLCSGSRQRRNL